jgi:hypothetical protein
LQRVASVAGNWLLGSAGREIELNIIIVKAVISKIAFVMKLLRSYLEKKKVVAAV